MTEPTANTTPADTKAAPIPECRRCGAHHYNTQPCRDGVHAGYVLFSERADCYVECASCAEWRRGRFLNSHAPTPPNNAPRKPRPSPQAARTDEPPPTNRRKRTPKRRHYADE